MRAKPGYISSSLLSLVLFPPCPLFARRDGDQLRDLPHRHDGPPGLPQLRGDDREERLHRHRLPRPSPEWRQGDREHHHLQQLLGRNWHHEVNFFLQNIFFILKYFLCSRYWSTSAIFSQGSRNLLISNNEVTRSMGNGIMIKSESLSKDYWAEQVRRDLN